MRSIMYENSDGQQQGGSRRRKRDADPTEYVYFAVGGDRYHILRAGEGSGVRAWCGMFYPASGVEVLQDRERPTRPVCRKCASKAPKPRRESEPVDRQGSLL